MKFSIQAFLAMSAFGLALTASAGQATITPVSKDTKTDSGEPITFPSTPNPEVTSVILSLPPGGKTDLDDASRSPAMSTCSKGN